MNRQIASVHTGPLQESQTEFPRKGLMISEKISVYGFTALL
jgi:hypothetical protein